jgi:hypothetical protein
MLPTLLGRWQTRILLFVFVGSPISAVYAVWLASLAPVTGRPQPWIRSLGGVIYDVRPLQIVCLLLIVGIALDMVYIGLQKFRWERDWPFVFQFFVCIIEFFIVLGLIKADALPFMPARWLSANEYPYFFLQFGLMFVPSFVALLGFIQIFMVRWRYKGGEWGRL